MSAGVMKRIAIIAMVIDHTATAFVPADTWLGLIMHMIGRITGPVMFFFIAEGYAHTRSVGKYAARLGCFALLSQVPYIYFWTGALPTAQYLLAGNVLFTQLFGLLALWAVDSLGKIRRERNTGPWPCCIAAAAVLTLGIASASCDWMYWGVLFILAFGFTAGKPSQRTNAVVLLALSCCIYVGYAGGVIWAGLEQMAILLVLPLLRHYNGQRGRGGKWFFYVFYPAHLLVLGYLKWGIPVLL